MTSSEPNSTESSARPVEDPELQQPQQQEIPVEAPVEANKELPPPSEESVHGPESTVQSRNGERGAWHAVAFPLARRERGA